MRILLTIAFCVICLLGYSQPVHQQAPFRPVKTITADLNNDGKTDTIRLSSNLPNKDYFNQISITLAGYKKQTFEAKNEWTYVDKWFLDSNKNSVTTKLLFLKKTPKHAVILLFGVLDPAGYRDAFSIINIENNTIKMVFEDYDQHLDVEVPAALADLGHDGRLCFVYRNLGEITKETPTGNIGTYNPLYVYPVDDSCKFNLPLTKKYNQDHYVYPGDNYSGEVLIFYPRNGGKPRVYKDKKKPS